MSPTIRAFIAIELPPSVISLLEKTQQDFKSAGLRAKWVRPENIHLTLKFLGNIDPGDIDKIGDAMSDTVMDLDPLTLAARGVGVFPGIKRPRVIWVGLGGQTQLLFAVQRKLEDNLAVIGFAKEKRPFKGHLTLGRFRQAVDPHTTSRVIQEHADLKSEDFTANRIVLFQSDLKPTGPVYSGLKQAIFNT
jgi:2'-5' RNA ligase